MVKGGAAAPLALPMGTPLISQPLTYGEIRKYECTYCDISFSNNKSLIFHLRTFAHKTNLNRHLSRIVDKKINSLDNCIDNQTYLLEKDKPLARKETNRNSLSEINVKLKEEQMDCGDTNYSEVNNLTELKFNLKVLYLTFY